LIVTDDNARENFREGDLRMPPVINKANWKMMWVGFLIISIGATVRAVWLVNAVPSGYVNIKGVCSQLRINLGQDAEWIIPLEGTGFKHLMVRRCKVYSLNQVNLKTDRSNKWQTITNLKTTEQIVDADIQIMPNRPFELHLKGELGTTVTFSREGAGQLEVEGVSGYMAGDGNMAISTDTAFHYSTPSDNKPKILQDQRFSLTVPGKPPREPLKIHFDAVRSIYSKIEARWDDDEKALERMQKRDTQVSSIDITDFQPSQVLIDAKTPKGIDQLKDIKISANIEAFESDIRPVKVLLENMSSEGIQISVEGTASGVRIDNKSVMDNRLTQVISDPFAKQNLLDWFLVIVWLGTIVMAVVKTVLEQKAHSLTGASQSDSRSDAI